MTGRSARRRVAAAGAASGGLLIAAGAALPWLTLYGGLHPLRGFIGMYGQLLLAVGIGIAAGSVLLLRAPRSAGRVLSAVALGVLAFAAWLAFGQVPAMLESLRQNPLLVAEAGSGPFVVLAGSLVLVGSAMLGVLGESRRDKTAAQGAPMD